MNRFLVFFLGFIAGVVTSFLGLIVIGVFIMGNRNVYHNDDYDDCAIAVDTVWVEEAVAVIEEPVCTDSIEVKGRNGYVNLAVGMSKEDVKARLGRPKTTEYSYGTETWKYEFPGEGMYGTHRQMIVNFRNGGLVTISQY